MNIKPIRNDDDLRQTFARLEEIFQAPEGSPEADEMEVLVALVEAYENRHYPFAPAGRPNAKLIALNLGRQRGFEHPTNRAPNSSSGDPATP